MDSNSRKGGSKTSHDIIPSSTYSHEMMRALDDAILQARFDTEVEVILPSGPVSARVVERPFYDPKKTLAAA